MVGWWGSVGVTVLLLAYLGVLWSEDFALRLRVRNVIRVFATMLHVFVLSILLMSGPSWDLPAAQPKTPQTQPVRVFIDGEDDEMIIRNRTTSRHGTDSPPPTTGNKAIAPNTTDPGHARRPWMNMPIATMISIQMHPPLPLTL